MVSSISSTRSPRYHARHASRRGPRDLFRPRQHALGNRAGADARGTHSRRLARGADTRGFRERFSAAEMLEVRAALLASNRTRRTTCRSCAARPSRAARPRWATSGTWRTKRSRSGTPRATRSSRTPKSSRRSRNSSARFRLATLSNGNADLAVIGLAHHFEVTLNAGALGCAKPDPRAYARARRRADTETRGNTVCRRRTSCRCGRSTDSWHANCMGE